MRGIFTKFIFFVQTRKIAATCLSRQWNLEWIESRSEEQYLRQKTICNRTRLDGQMMTLKTWEMFLYTKLCSVNILERRKWDDCKATEESWKLETNSDWLGSDEQRKWQNLLETAFYIMSNIFLYQEKISYSFSPGISNATSSSNAFFEWSQLFILRTSVVLCGLNIFPHSRALPPTTRIFVFVWW